MGAGEGAIDTLVLLDREVDSITPLMTQLTYEGLVDELLGITNGTVQFDVSGGLPLSKAYIANSVSFAQPCSIMTHYCLLLQLPFTAQTQGSA